MLAFRVQHATTFFSRNSYVELIKKSFRDLKQSGHNWSDRLYNNNWSDRLYIVEAESQPENAHQLILASIYAAEARHSRAA